MDNIAILATSSAENHYLTMFFTIIGGLGIFLLGMKNMSEGMQMVAGEKLRVMINAVTNNRLLACLVGVIVTLLMQSSSITTVMVVGMVNASIMSLTQAIGVILGANIGTTITGWIITLKIGKYGLPIIGIAAFFFLFSRRERVRYTAMLMLGLGMIFFGLMQMKTGFEPLKEMEWFREWFQKFRPENYFGVIKCCLVGAVLTAIVQSSSATLAITMSLAAIGAIDYPTAAALVLGENIGTTITAFLASVGSSTAARRASFAHIFINIFGVLWITFIFFWYVDFIRYIFGVDTNMSLAGPVAMSASELKAAGLMSAVKMQTCIAMTHTFFNLINVIVLLPFVGVLAKFLEKIVPERKVIEPTHLTYLDVRLLDTPTISIEQTQRETLRMGSIASDMMVDLKDSICDIKNTKNKQDKIFEDENKLDFIQKEIAVFLGKIMGLSLPQDVTIMVNQQLRIADEFESISDYITAILKLDLKIINNNDELTNGGYTDMMALHDQVADYINFVIKGIKGGKSDILPEAQVRGKSITLFMKEARDRHLLRVGTGEVSPLKSLAFTDMLNAYRRIKDHAYNIAETIAGEK